MKKYEVVLTAPERQQLHDLIAAGKAAARKLAHARILLQADVGPDGPAWTDERVAEALDVCVGTVERVRKRFAQQGLEEAVRGKKPHRPNRERKLNGQAEAQLVALVQSPPPKGSAYWTMQLLAEKLVELQIVDAICDETVRRALKRINGPRKS